MILLLQLLVFTHEAACFGNQRSSTSCSAVLSVVVSLGKQEPQEDDVPFLILIRRSDLKNWTA